MVIVTTMDRYTYYMEYHHCCTIITCIIHYINSIIHFNQLQCYTAVKIVNLLCILYNNINESITDNSDVIINRCHDEHWSSE
jgi:hypothetical protein